MNERMNERIEMKNAWSILNFLCRFYTVCSHAGV